MDNLKIRVVITTIEKFISTEPPGDVEGNCSNLFWKKLAHTANILHQNFCYELQRIYDAKLKFHKVQMHRLE
jgi:hypothetical protein